MTSKHAPRYAIEVPGILILSGMFLASGAGAQTGPSVPTTPSEEIAEIVVTAQKRNQSVIDVPISITAVSEEQLLARGVSSTADLAQLVPGLTAAPTPYNTPVYNLRGIGYYDSALSAAPTVAVYTDEVPLPFSAMTTVAALDDERVEVLKGPQGTLFGNSTTGGLINFVANKPTDHFDGGTNVSYGRFDTVDLQGFVSGPVAPNTNARLAVRSIQSGDWQYSQSRPDTLGAQRVFQSRLLVDWTGIDKLKLSLNLNGFVNNSDTQAAQLQKIVFANPSSPRAGAELNLQPAPANDRAADWAPNNGFGPLRNNNYFYQLAIRADYEVSSALTLTSITAGEKYRLLANESYDGTDRLISETQPSGRIDTVSQEIRAGGTSGPLIYVAGANYERDSTIDQLDENFTDSTTSTVGPYSLTTTGNYSKQNITTMAVFGNLEWQVMNRLAIIGGARYTDTLRNFQGCSQDFIPPFTTNVAFNFIESVFRPTGFTFIGPGQCWTFKPGYIPYANGTVLQKLDQDNVSWHAGINYKPNDSGLIYASASKGFKPGGFPTTTATSDVQYKPVTQESLLAYEVGIKQPLLNNRVQLIGAAFYYDYANKQIQGKEVDPIFGPLNALVNVPKSHVEGLEGQIIARPFTGYSLNFAATYLETKITTFTGINGAGADQNFAGSAFPYSPKWQLVADNQYEFSLRGWRNLFVGANVTFNSATNANIGAPVDYKIPAYPLIGARAGVKWDDDHWMAQVWGKNVANRYYWTNVILFNDALVRYAGMPATFGISVNYRFR